MVKGDGGAVGLTNSPSVLCRWMVLGPEMARLVNEFENSMLTEAGSQEVNHHEVQKKKLPSVIL